MSGALIIKIGFWDILYYKYNKEPTKQYRSRYLLIKAPILRNQAPVPSLDPEPESLCQSIQPDKNPPLRV